MTTADALRAEFDRETCATRRYLERVPGDRLAWRPHQKSFTALRLLDVQVPGAYEPTADE